MNMKKHEETVMTFVSRPFVQSIYQTTTEDSHANCKERCPG